MRYSKQKFYFIYRKFTGDHVSETNQNLESKDNPPYKKSFSGSTFTNSRQTLVSTHCKQVSVYSKPAARMADSDAKNGPQISDGSKFSSSVWPGLSSATESADAGAAAEENCILTSEDDDGFMLVETIADNMAKNLEQAKAGDNSTGFADGFDTHSSSDDIWASLQRTFENLEQEAASLKAADSKSAALADIGKSNAGFVAGSGQCSRAQSTKTDLDTALGKLEKTFKKLEAGETGAVNSASEMMRQLSLLDTGEPEAKMSRTDQIENFSSVPDKRHRLLKLQEKLNEVVFAERNTNGNRSSSQLVISSGIIPELVEFYKSGELKDAKIIQQMLKLFSFSLGGDSESTANALSFGFFDIVKELLLSSKDKNTLVWAVACIHNIVVDKVRSDLVVQDYQIYKAIMDIALDAVKTAELNTGSSDTDELLGYTSKTITEFFENATDCACAFQQKVTIANLFQSYLVVDKYNDVVLRCVLHLVVNPDKYVYWTSMDHASNFCANLIHKYSGTYRNFVGEDFWTSVIYRVNYGNSLLAKAYAVSLLDTMVLTLDDFFVQIVLNQVNFQVFRDILKVESKDGARLYACRRHVWRLFGNMATCRLVQCITRMLDLGLLSLIATELKNHTDPSQKAWNDALWTLYNISDEREDNWFPIKERIKDARILELLLDIRENSASRIIKRDDLLELPKLIEELLEEDDQSDDESASQCMHAQNNKDEEGNEENEDPSDRSDCMLLDITKN